MAAKKSSSGHDDIATLFATAAQSSDPKAWDAPRAALVQAVAKCGAAADLEKLLRTRGVCDGFLGEAEAWPEVADAIVALAERSSG